MKNKRQIRRCSLSVYWGARDEEVNDAYNHAHLVMDTLIKGGMTEQQAKEAVEKLWSNGHNNGYLDGCFDSSDV